jgi:leader peptidase (prepilin peptidase)/N-methyltransferase
MASEWIWLVFVFAFGSCIGSFLNVVIYRLPRDKSLVTPPSACPGCDKRIAFYDNIPLVSWLVLAGKCRNCKMKITPRYFFVELLTAVLFLAVFVLYFIHPVRTIKIDGVIGLEAFVSGAWLMYASHIILVAALIAASGIDLELWIIPLSICWFATVIGVAAAAVSGYVIDPVVINTFDLFPMASAKTGIIALGGGIGLILSLIGLKLGIIKRSYESDIKHELDADKEGSESDYPSQQPGYPHRKEIAKEIVFLTPVLVCGWLGYMLFSNVPAIEAGWIDLLQQPAIAGFMGSLYGYLIGCAVVWITRILGTLAFGKEAMGLGDVHLMGAAGAVIGYKLIIVAFFVAPFFGLAWAMYQAISKKTRQIPYGPFLSMGVFAVMIYHDRVMVWLMNYLSAFYM